MNGIRVYNHSLLSNHEIANNRIMVAHSLFPQHCQTHRDIASQPRKNVVDYHQVLCQLALTFPRPRLEVVESLLVI